MFAGIPLQPKRQDSAMRTRLHSMALAVIAALSGMCSSPETSAGPGDAKATSAAGPSHVQQTAHAHEPGFALEICPPTPFALPSKYYGLWEPTEVFGRDARCQPTPFAPRGYGFPKKLSPYRMEYSPYRVRDCGFGSVHGPSLWLRRHRDPCCGPGCGGCRQCQVGVDPQ